MLDAGKTQFARLAFDDQGHLDVVEQPHPLRVEGVGAPKQT